MHPCFSWELGAVFSCPRLSRGSGTQADALSLLLLRKHSGSGAIGQETGWEFRSSDCGAPCCSEFEAWRYVRQWLHWPRLVAKTVATPRRPTARPTIVSQPPWRSPPPPWPAEGRRETETSEIRGGVPNACAIASVAVAVGVTGVLVAVGVTGVLVAVGVTGVLVAVGVTGVLVAVGVTGVLVAVGVTGVLVAVGVTGVLVAVGVTGVLVAVGVTGVLVAVGVTGVLVAVGVTGVLVAVGVTGVLVAVGVTGVLVAVGVTAE